MNGIDISNWQKGIDLDNVPFDFMICKATQGTTFVDRYCDTFVQKAIRLGKPWGVYHYVNGSNAEAEATHFVEACKGYIGNGILAVDWERDQNRQWGNLSYLRLLLSAIIDKTNIQPLIYASASSFPWDIARELNCGTWVAQYANERATGYQNDPWNENAYTCTIRQYSSCGKLPGYGNYLDLNKAYITAAQWAEYANPSGNDTDSTATVDVLQLATDTIKGKYGTGIPRKEALGSNYEAVQAKVNNLYAKANDVIKGKYGNGSARKEALGSEYAIVQYIVNDILDC